MRWGWGGSDRKACPADQQLPLGRAWRFSLPDAPHHRVRQTLHDRQITFIKIKRLRSENHQAANRAAFIANRRGQNRSYSEPSATFQVHSRIDLGIVAAQ